MNLTLISAHAIDLAFVFRPQQCKCQHGAQAGDSEYGVGRRGGLLLWKPRIQWRSGWDVIRFIPSHDGVAGRRFVKHFSFYARLDENGTIRTQENFDHLNSIFFICNDEVLRGLDLILFKSIMSLKIGSQR